MFSFLENKLQLISSITARWLKKKTKKTPKSPLNVTSVKRSPELVLTSPDQSMAQELQCQRPSQGALTSLPAWPRALQGEQSSGAQVLPRGPPALMTQGYKHHSWHDWTDHMSLLSVPSLLTCSKLPSGVLFPFKTPINLFN